MNKSYVAGFFENTGGFYILHNKKRKSFNPKFKLTCSKDNLEKNDVVSEILDWLFKNYGILFNAYEANDAIVYMTSRSSSLEALLDFFEENCRIKKKYHDMSRKVLLYKKTKAKLKYELRDKQYESFKKKYEEENP